MYLDLHPTAHARFAAYQTISGADAAQAGLADQWAVQLKSIENTYNLGKAQVSASLKNASTAANASIKGAQIGANAQIKTAKIGAETDRYVANLRADVDRENIRTQAAVEREKIGQAREEMFRIGIPSMLIDAWTATKNYEIARMGIGLDIAKTAAEYASTPDKYWIARDFEAAIPALLGGDMNGPTAAPGGAPTPNNLTDLVSQLGIGSMFAGESPTTGTTSSGNLYEDMLKQSQEPVPAAAPVAGTTAMGAPTGQQNGAGWIDALTQQGIQAWGGLDLNTKQVSQGDVDAWFQSLQQAGDRDPNDPRIVAAAQAALANGFATPTYDAWKASMQPAQTAQPAAAPTASMSTTTPTTSPLAAATGQLNPQDQAMLANIGTMMQNGGINPFVFQNLNPTQKAVLLGGVARSGYDANAELWKAATKLPGQGDPLAA